MKRILLSFKKKVEDKFNSFFNKKIDISIEEEYFDPSFVNEDVIFDVLERRFNSDDKFESKDMIEYLRSKNIKNISDDKLLMKEVFGEAAIPKETFSRKQIFSDQLN